MNVTQTRNQQAFDRQKKRNQYCLSWLKQLKQNCRKQHRKTVAIGVLNGLLIIVQAFLLALILHHLVIEKANWLAIQDYAIMLVLVIVLRSICIYAYQVSGFAAAQRIRQTIHQQLLDKLYSLGPFGLKNHHSAQLAAIIQQQTEAIDPYFSRYLPQQAIVVVVPLLIMFTAFYVNWVVGCILLVTGPLVIVFMALIGMGAESASRNQFLEMERMGAFYLDRIQGLTTLKLFGRVALELESIGKVAEVFKTKTMAVLRIAFISSAVLEFFSAVAVALVAVYVGLGLLGLIHFGPAQDISLQQALFVLLLAPEFFLPLRQLAVHYHDKASAVAAADRILTILEQSPGVVDESKAEAKKHSDYAIEINNLSKSFSERMILNNITLKINPSDKYVLMGESGAGKSTLLRILMGLELPDSGTVIIHGAPCQREWAARHIAWISQNPRLFNASIADNISLFNEQISKQAIATAAYAAGVTEFSDSLPDKLETMIGENGYGLSGGQLKRIALARAFLKDCDIILLDEPTAHLDDASKKQLLDKVIELFANKTVIIASHDSMVMEYMDHYLMLDDGVIR